MEFFKQNTKIKFMAAKKWTAMVSALLFIASIAALVVNGLNFGLEFTGGTQFELQYKQAANLSQIRQDLERVGFKEAVVQNFGPLRDVQVTIATPTSVSSNDQQLKVYQQQVQEKITQTLPDADIVRADFVGPQVGKELATKGALAIFVSLLATMIYIAMRFEWRFAVSSTVALIHDPMLILGMFAFFHWTFDLNSLAALLTVIGFSLNDTIVIFDRVRENFRKLRKNTPTEVVDISVNQTLSRTIMTSGLTMLAVVALFVYGGPAIHGFSLAMIIGIVIGTYSSIYVAGALALWMGLTRQDLMLVAKAVDNRP